MGKKTGASYIKYIALDKGVLFFKLQGEPHIEGVAHLMRSLY